MKNLPRKFVVTLWVFGLMGQVAWIVENMYFNVFIYKMFHASAASISVMVGASAATATITTLIAGTFSDRAGRRKPFICGGYILWGISILCFCFLRTDILAGITKDIAAAMSLGVNLTILMDCVMTIFGSTANDACFNAWLTESGDASNRGAIEGVNAMMPMIAILVVFGGFMSFDLDQPSSWTAIYAIIGVSTVIIGVLGIFTIEDTRPASSGDKSFLRHLLYSFKPQILRENVLLYLIVGCFAIFGISIQTYMPYLILYYEVGLGMDNYVLIMAPAIILAAVFSVVYGRLYDQLGFEKSVYPSIGILLSGYVILYFTRTAIPVFLGSLLMMSGYLSGMAVFGARIREETPEDQTGLFQGIRIFGQVLVPGIIGPAVGAAVLKDADQIVGSDGTSSFIPNSKIFLAAFVVGLILIAALEFLFYIIRKEHNKLETPYMPETPEIQDDADSLHGTRKDFGTKKTYSTRKVFPAWSDTYPRPQLVRDRWISLDGKWDSGHNVPFPPESDLGSIYASEASSRQSKSSRHPGKRYTKRICLPGDFAQGCSHVLLHFGAVDQFCGVFINGKKAAEHKGGYLPFTVDITEAVHDPLDTDASRPAIELSLEVEVTDRLSHLWPYGKQKKRRGGMWYTPISGIWKSVWLEAVPEKAIEKVLITPVKAEAGEGIVDISVIGGEAPYYLELYDAESSSELGTESNSELGTESSSELITESSSESDASVPLVLSSEDGHFHIDFRKLGLKPRYWTPDDPWLYHFTITCGKGSSRLHDSSPITHFTITCGKDTAKDKARSYFALRTIDTRLIDGINRICLNGHPIFLHGILDQGYFPEGILVPASPTVYEGDIKTLKSMGFNLIRKHIKVEPEAFYEACDRLGMLVMQDMVNSGHYSFLFDTAFPTLGMKKKRLLPPIALKKRISIFKEQMVETAKTLYNHPCIIAYTIYNEGWGEIKTGSMYDALKDADPTRLIDTCSGWFTPEKSDFDSRHLYFDNEEMHPEGVLPLLLTEFGGYTRPVTGHMYSKYAAYGYGACESESQLTDRIIDSYEQMVIPSIKNGMTGSIYTQLTDVEDEINGLMTYDRRIVKVDAGRMLNLACRLKEIHTKACRSSLPYSHFCSYLR